MLAVRQTDVHGINSVIGQQIVVRCMNLFRFKGRRPLFIAAGNGIQVCTTRCMHGWGETATSNKASA
jgi:hypothetical protein